MNRRIFVIRLLCAAVVMAAGFAYLHPDALAALSPSPCAGNVCTGTVVVGNQTVSYSYTEHLAPNGTLRIRLNGGVYNTASLISFIAFNLPSFSTWDKMANPNNGAVFLPLEDANPGRTAYERSDADGCVSCIVDQTMSVTYGSLAPGAYTFDLSIVQNGDTGGKSLTFYVDAGAPTNANESTAWAAVSGMNAPCADGVDNDLDYQGDCADVQCNGAVGNVGSGALCEQPETTCNDAFDNDADGLPDCLDPSCDGRVGQPSGSALCQYGNEYGASTCGDAFDNDGDGLTDCVDNAFNPLAGGSSSTTCWKKPAFGCPATEISCTDSIDNDKDLSYSDNWDSAPLTGRDCTDYDCAGNASCPAQENQLAGGASADAQCFDGIDNDLDHLVDCADPNCLGIVNPLNPSQVCYDKEFDLGQKYQYCGNSFDDDGDTPKDCADSDCARRFGNCGPCPAREDYTYDSCADGKDNDVDAAQDCADADCSGKLGSTALGAMCAAGETSNALCGDGFDNDLDGKIDCADADCAGRTGQNGQVCQPAAETSCADGLDNDGDGVIDCADSQCWTGASCAMKNWTNAACVTVPRDSSATAFTSNSPTVLATVRLGVRAAQPDRIRLQGSGTYSSLTVIVGDNTDSTKYYPYASSLGGCALTDTATGIAAARFSFTAIDGHAVQIYNTPGADIATFDLTFACATPAIPAAKKDYTLSLSALKSSGAAEYGDLSESTTLYEGTVPSVTSVEVEGAIGGTVRVPYGGTAAAYSRRLRGVPTDPGGAAPASSGICRCDLTVNGVSNPTTADCTTSAMTFLSDVTLSVSAVTEDGAGNVSGSYAAPATTINVVPTIDTALAITPAKPFFHAAEMTMGADVRFLTGFTDTFGATCGVYVRDASGTLIGGPVGPTATFAGMPVGNLIACLGSVTFPSVADGRYTVTVRATDSDGDTGDSAAQVAYMCNTVPMAGDPEPTNGCQYADFDRDGSAEGLYTTLYSSAPKSCDNCVGLANANQADTNANGIGDVCEPAQQYGRCEIDKDIVCSWNSNDAAHGCPAGELCCPGPSIANDPATGAPKDPQLCKSVWGICSDMGEVCFTDLQCTSGGLLPGGFGTCQDSITGCKRDVDCAALSGTPLCTGANICDNLLNPWLETAQGSLFSRKRITAPDVPPQNRFNATFCIVAKDLILNFKSAQCAASTDVATELDRPKASNSYRTVLGTLDIAGLRAGKYGQVVEVGAGSLDGTLSSYANRMEGKVFRVQGDATVSARTFQNGAVSGAGTILVDGGDLTITGDIGYQASSVTSMNTLASLGWVVMPTSGGLKGNVYVDGTVANIVGAFYVGGDDGFWTVAPPVPDSETPFTLQGLAVAKSFHFSRSFKSKERGSEQFIYDGRAVANPPPGFADVTKSLPLFSDSLP